MIHVSAGVGHDVDYLPEAPAVAEDARLGVHRVEPLDDELLVAAAHLAALHAAVRGPPHGKQVHAIDAAVVGPDARVAIAIELNTVNVEGAGVVGRHVGPQLIERRVDDLTGRHENTTLRRARTGSARRR